MSKKHKDDDDEDVLVEGGEGGYALVYPTLDENGEAKVPNYATVAFVSAWLVQMARLQRDNPVKAAQLREIFGYDPAAPIVVTDAVLR